MTTIKEWPEDMTELVKQAIEKNEFPRKLYKYRPLSVEDDKGKRLIGGIRTEKIIKTSSFWFANPHSFNDPFDCHLSLESNISASDVGRKLNELGLKGRLDNNQKNDLRTDPTEFKNNLKKVNDKVMSNVGILSLAKGYKNILMWSHYAESHTGMVFELDLKKSPRFFTTPIKVDYKDQYKPLDFINDVQGSIDRNIQLKSKHWDYEEEIRIFKLGSGNYPINEQAISKIYFGCRSSKADRDRIIKLCGKHGFQHVEFYKGETVYGKFELSFHRI